MTGDKLVGGVDKHSDSGHKEAEFSKVGAHHDKHVEARAEGHNEKKKGSVEYSHDRGHGFVKSWSWDRANLKADAEAKLKKKLKELAAGSKGGFGAVEGKASQSHDRKGLTGAIAGVTYLEADNDQSSHKSSIDTGFPSLA